MEPVLPDGDDKCCRLLVDTKPVFSAAIEWWGSSTTLQRVAADAIGVDPYHRATPDRKYIRSSTGAVGSMGCSDQKDLKGRVFVSVRTTHSATEEEMKTLLTSYSASVASSEECTRQWGGLR